MARASVCCNHAFDLLYGCGFIKLAWRKVSFFFIGKENIVLCVCLIGNRVHR